MTCDLAPNSVGSSYEAKDFVIAVASEDCRLVFAKGQQGINSNNSNCLYFCCCWSYPQTSFAWCYYQTVYVHFIITNVTVTSGFSILVGCHLMTPTSLQVSCTQSHFALLGVSVLWGCLKLFSTAVAWYGSIWVFVSAWTRLLKWSIMTQTEQSILSV